MKKNQPSTLPDPAPENTPSSPYQQLGCLRILRGSIVLACVNLRGVELILSTGISLGIPWAEARKLGFASRETFAHGLELGADFPELRFTVTVMKDFKPLWLDSTSEPPKPPRRPKPDHAGDQADADDASAKEKEGAAEEAPVSLPLPTYIPPFVPRRGGGGGIGGR